MNAKKRFISLLGMLAFIFIMALLNPFAQSNAYAQVGGGKDWRIYNGGSHGTHYSSLKQINRDNVQNLKLAWTFDTEDDYPGSELQCNPLVVRSEEHRSELQ